MIRVARFSKMFLFTSLCPIDYRIHSKLQLWHQLSFFLLNNSYIFPPKKYFYGRPVEIFFFVTRCAGNKVIFEVGLRIASHARVHIFPTHSTFLPPNYRIHLFYSILKIIFSSLFSFCVFLSVRDSSIEWNTDIRKQAFSKYEVMKLVFWILNLLNFVEIHKSLG